MARLSKRRCDAPGDAAMTEAGVRIRRARPDEADLLGELAMRSKAYWGYSRAFMEACRAELSYPASRIECDANSVAVAELAGEVAGFYLLRRESEDVFELEALFVEPDCIGSGIGRALIEHAKSEGARRGGRRLVIQGDPHAERFYRAAGGVPIGQRPSASIPGRQLPLFSIELVPDRRA